MVVHVEGVPLKGWDRVQFIGIHGQVVNQLHLIVFDCFLKTNGRFFYGD